MAKTKNSTTESKQSKTTAKKETASTKKTETAKKKAKYTRAHSFCDALKGKPKTIKKIAANMVEMYAKKNPDQKKKPSESTSIWVAKDYIQPLIILGFVSEETVEGSKEKRYSLKS